MTGRRSGEAIAWARWYRTARWRRLRERQLTDHPLCEWCLDQDIVEPATEVHHRIAHKGDEDLFWGGPFRSTCKSCHSRFGAMEDRGKTIVMFDADGWPV